jgi:hypothetical protein
VFNYASEEVSKRKEFFEINEAIAKTTREKN